MTERPDEAVDDQSRTPLLRVVNADATPEEIAALVAVLAALGSAGGEAPRAARPSWNDPSRAVRRTDSTGHHAGLGGWRASGLPR